MPAPSSSLASTVTIAVAIASAVAVLLSRREKRKKSHPFPFRRVQRRRVHELPPLKNDLVVRALLGKPTERVPVWCMRQAGRHLPEFRSLREAGYDFFTMCSVPELAVEVSLQPFRRYGVDAAGYDFFTMCSVPELAVEVSLQPFRRYGVDAVIIFSDILVIPMAMGMQISMVPSVGPVFSKPIRELKDVEEINLTPDVEQTLGYVLDAINLARKEINGRVPLIGFCGGPLTLLCYMIEGRGSRTKSLFKTFLYEHPTEAHTILYAITDICVRFLVAQQRAGAQVLQVFESVAAESVTQEHYFEFAFPYLEQIAARVKDACGENVPVVCFSKGTPYAYKALATTKYDCLQVDWQSDICQVRDIVDGKVSLQGNLDPCAIYASPETIQSNVREMLEAFGTQRYVANLGHGCFPDMAPSHLDTFVKAVQEISMQMNENKQ
ncbi:hypothetical protein ABG067_000188 [Albugo candida]